MGFEVRPAEPAVSPDRLGKGTHHGRLQGSAELLPLGNREQRDQEPVLRNLLRQHEPVGVLLGVPDAQGQIPAFVSDPGSQIQIPPRQGEGCSQAFKPFPITPGVPVGGQVVAIPLFRQLSPVFIKGDPREFLRPSWSRFAHRPRDRHLVAHPVPSPAGQEPRLEMRNQMRGVGLAEEARRESCALVLEVGQEPRLLSAARRRQGPRSLTQNLADPPRAIRRIQAFQALHESKDQTPGGIRGMFRRLRRTLRPRGRARKVFSRGPGVIQFPRRTQDVHDGQRNCRVGGIPRDPLHDRARIGTRRPSHQAPRRPGLHGRRLQPGDQRGSFFAGELDREINQVGHRRVKSLIHQLEALFFEPRKGAHGPIAGYGSPEAVELRVLGAGRTTIVLHASVGPVQHIHRRAHQGLDFFLGPTLPDHLGGQFESDRSDRPDRVFGAARTDPLDHQIGDRLGAIRFQPPGAGARIEPVADRHDGAILIGRRHMLPDHGFDVVEHRPLGPRRSSGPKDPPDRLAGHRRQGGTAARPGRHHEISRTSTSEEGLSGSRAHNCSASAR